MSLIQDNALLIIGILLVLIIIEGLVISVQNKNKSKNKRKNKCGSSSSVSKEKYEKACKERDDYRSKVEQLKRDSRNKEKEWEDLKIRYDRNRDDYGKVIVENQQLKHTLEELNNDTLILENKIRELTHKNDEPNKLLGNGPVPNVPKTASTVIPTPVNPQSKPKEVPANNDTSKSAQPAAEDVSSAVEEQKQNDSKEEQKVEVSQENPKIIPSKEETKTELTMVESKAELPKDEKKIGPIRERTMYASFPRSAGNNSYFSDLSENRVDDSYFELKISFASSTATFKPLDFMKIRNYDPAMAAMLTEGVKPNVASTVIGIEPGKAHLEGKDWIIDNLAKIKLA